MILSTRQLLLSQNRILILYSLISNYQEKQGEGQWNNCWDDRLSYDVQALCNYRI